jgi:hypothetical protein
MDSDLPVPAGWPRVCAITVAAAGLLLAISPLIPWVTITYDLAQIGYVGEPGTWKAGSPTTVTHARGIDDPGGWLVLAAGLAVSALAAAAVTGRRELTSWAAVPGGAALLVVLILLADIDAVLGPSRNPYLPFPVGGAVTAGPAWGVFVALCLAGGIVLLSLSSLLRPPAPQPA